MPLSLEEHKNPSYITPKLLYTAEENVDRWSRRRLNRRWLISFMNVTSATNHRTAICAVLPDSATDYSLRFVLFDQADAAHGA